MFFNRSISKKNHLFKLIVGLGNYGAFYEQTRHNAGFEAVDYIAKRYGVNFKVVKKFDGLFGMGEIAGKVCGLLKPLTFMNNSGVAVKKVCKFYKLSLENVLVLVDDVSFDCGKIRIKQRGSAGTHNGLKSIVFEVDGENFLRIKIGVGKKPSESFDLAKWVLAKFDDESMSKMQVAYSNVADAVELILNNKTNLAMNSYN